VFEIPTFLLDALRFRETRREVLRGVTDHQWRAVLSGWSTARLAIALRQDRDDDADWRADRRGDELCRPKKVKHHAECDRAYVDEGRTEEPKVCDVRHGGSQTAVISRIVYTVSPRTTQCLRGRRTVK